MSANAKSYSHYFKTVPLETKPDGSVGPVTHIDIYNVIEMWEVFRPAPAHALKKLACAGLRGAKDYAKDLREVIACCARELELVEQRSVTEAEIDLQACRKQGLCAPKSAIVSGHEPYRCEEKVESDLDAGVTHSCNQVLPCPKHELYRCEERINSFSDPGTTYICNEVLPCPKHSNLM